MRFDLVFCYAVPVITMFMPKDVSAEAPDDAVRVRVTDVVAPAAKVVMAGDQVTDR
jgi:hypothetical protein